MKWRKTYNVNYNQMKTGVPITIPVTADFRTRKIIRDKKEYSCSTGQIQVVHSVKREYPIFYHAHLLAL